MTKIKKSIKWYFFKFKLTNICTVIKKHKIYNSMFKYLDYLH